MKKFRKVLSVLIITIIVFFNSPVVWAVDAPNAPDTSTPPPTPTQSEPIQSQPTPTPSNLAEPTPPPAPNEAVTPENLDANAQAQQDEYNDWWQQQQAPQSDEEAEDSSTANNNSDLPAGNQTGGQNGDGQTGGSIVNTGNATNNAGISTIANSNLSAGVAADSGDSASVINDSNGQSSANNGSLSIIDNNSTIQNNEADVTSNLTQNTVSGQNSASGNVGNAIINSGDSNTTGTIISSVNTNVDGVAVAEFNVVEDHMGDIVLDFSSGCVVGCGGGDLLAANTGNGQNSNNDVSIDSTTNNSTFQNNDATLENNMALASDSGNNDANGNTGGDTEINTGDANVSGNILNFANNNVSGNVVFAVVNIFGDLVGDIIFPEDIASTACNGCSSDILAANTGNGQNSTNQTVVEQTTNSNTFESNDATIENNLLLDANTGGNSTSGNTSGDAMITTGNTTVDVNVLNVANTNVNEGSWWLVIVNEAGNWIGKILGAPDGTNFAGSEGTEFRVNENGEITAVNTGNGQGSSNQTSVSSTTNNTTSQTNNADIVNDVNLSANSGKNHADGNTGGESMIRTGDANIVANIVNFVNNNITGGGKLYVTVVNVFGSWVGDFVTPGSKKEQEQQQTQQQNTASGGSNSDQTASTTSTSSNQPGDSANNNSSSNNNTSQNNVTTTNNPGQILLAGFNSNQPLTLGTSTAKVDSKQTLKINLAWALLLLPIVAALILIKKLEVR